MLNKMKASGLVWIWISLLVIIVDRLSKSLVMTHLVYYQPLNVLPFFNLMLTYNTGAAFSFLHNASGWQNIFLGGLAVIVSVVIVTWLYQTDRKERWISVALCLVLGGALANAMDRVIYGYVIDFLSFYVGSWHFAIFNIADSAISIGAVMICLYWVLPALIKVKAK